VGSHHAFDRADAALELGDPVQQHEYAQRDAQDQPAEVRLRVLVHVCIPQ